MNDQLRKAAQRDDSDNKKPKQLAVERERNFCERCGKRLGGANHIHTCTPPQPDDEHDELFCWKVHGTSDEFTGYMAEEEAKAVAKRIGGTAFAFALYVRPQPVAKRMETDVNGRERMEPPTDIAAYIDWILRGGRFDNSHRAPQPAHKWVGLTESETMEVANNANTFIECVRMTSAKLNEKNT